MSVILCLVPVPTAPILRPESDLRNHDHISRQEREDLKLTTELFEKVQYSHHQTIKNGLNEAILLMWIKKALLSR